MTVIPSLRAQNFKGSTGIMIMVKLYMVIFLLHSSILGQNKKKKTDYCRWVMGIAAYKQWVVQWMNGRANGRAFGLY